MTILHKDIQSADCHEPKGITGAATSDAGKVITPSKTVAGTSELRRLDSTDLTMRITALTDAATIASDATTTDMGTVTLGANRTLGAPSGTAKNGQLLVYRVTQDGTGGRVLSFDSVFTFQVNLPAPDLAANTTAYYAFRYNTTSSKWEQYIKPVGGIAYSGKTIKNNGTAIAVPAMTDATNFSTAGDWRQVTGVFESPEVAPSVNFTRGTNDVTVLITGVYHIEFDASSQHSVNTSQVAFTFGINGTVQPDRPQIHLFATSGANYHLHAHAYATLTAGQVVTVWTASDKAGNITTRQGRFSLTLINRTV